MSCPDRERKILDNMGLVYKVVNTMAPRLKRDRDDLVSAGVEGLIHAIDRFDESKGFKFSSYAVTCIRGKILVDQRTHKKWFGATPTGSNWNDIDRQVVRIGSLEGAGRGTWDLPAPEVSVVDQVSGTFETLLGLVPDLRKRNVLRWRAEGLTLETIGQRLGVSRERVRQIEQQALRHVRKECGVAA